MTGIIIAVIATLVVSKLYRMSPLCDPGSAIWHTTSEVHTDVTVGIFKRFVARKTIDIGDNAVVRFLFPSTFDIVNRTIDVNLAMELDAWGVTSARAIVKHDPLAVAVQIVREVHERGSNAKIIDNIPHTSGATWRSSWSKVRAGCTSSVGTPS